MIHFISIPQCIESIDWGQREKKKRIFIKIEKLAGQTFQEMSMPYTTNNNILLNKMKQAKTWPSSVWSNSKKKT